jgi:hypothetical protein
VNVDAQGVVIRYLHAVIARHNRHASKYRALGMPSSFTTISTV